MQQRTKVTNTPHSCVTHYTQAAVVCGLSVADLI